MEEFNILVLVKKYKWLIIIMLTIFIFGLFVFLWGRHQNETNLENYLKNNEYLHKNHSYYKIINKSNNNDIDITNYIFSIKANKFIKNIERSSNNMHETIKIEYNGTENITISYYLEQYSENVSTISHEALYNLNNNKFKCKISSVKGNSKTKCSVIKNEAKIFSSEIKEILKKANINQIFTTKNSDDI